MAERTESIETAVEGIVTAAIARQQTESVLEQILREGRGACWRKRWSWRCRSTSSGCGSRHGGDIVNSCGWRSSVGWRTRASESVFANGASVVRAAALNSPSTKVLPARTWVRSRWLLRRRQPFSAAVASLWTMVTVARREPHPLV